MMTAWRFGRLRTSPSSEWPNNGNTSSAWRSVASWSKALAILLLGVMYSGAERFLVTFSSPLHYGFDLVLAGLILVVLLGGRLRGAVTALWPYQLWIAWYFLWGTIVSPHPDVATILSALTLNLLVLAAVGASIATGADVRRLANLVQLGVIINFAIAIWELADPQLIGAIARQLNADATAFNIDRPAGLWANPNEAGIALLFGFLLARWANRPLRLTGRTAAVVGIFLTASRGAMYPLLLCVLVLVLSQLKHNGLSGKQAPVTVFVSVLALLLTVPAAIPVVSGFLQDNPRAAYTLQRIQDLTQVTQDPVADPGRALVASLYVERASTGPVQGSGVFSFHGETGYLGAHDIYIAVWGETGLFNLALFLLLLIFGIARAYRAARHTSDLTVVLLMWVCYLMVGFVWHNQFDSLIGILVVALLFRLPTALRDSVNDAERPVGVSTPLVLERKSLPVSVR